MVDGVKVKRKEGNECGEVGCKKKMKNFAQKNF